MINDFIAILQASTVDRAYLRSMAGANGNFSALTSGTYTKNFRTFMSDGNLVVTKLMAVSNTVPIDQATPIDVTLQVISSNVAVLPTGIVYSIGDNWTFTSIVTAAGIAILNY
jgi:hypothetical protein